MTFKPLRHAVFLAVASASLHAQQPVVFSTGLVAPEKMIVGPSGSLLVSEAGQGANAGRVSIVTSAGVRRSLVEALPGGLAITGGTDGPSGLVLDDNVLYLAIGEGDQLVAGATQG